MARPLLPPLVGELVRCHDVYGDDLGLATVPGPVCVGDLVALEHDPRPMRVQPKKSPEAAERNGGSRAKCPLRTERHCGTRPRGA